MADEEDSYAGEPKDDGREPEHKGHYECPKCDRIQEGLGLCSVCGVPTEPAD